MISTRSISFQLTHSRGVRLRTKLLKIRLKLFQLTHSRGVRLCGEICYNRPCLISTHALTWSATSPETRQRICWKISTHALTWSATFYQQPTSYQLAFQLTHSRGVRQSKNTRLRLEKRFQLTHSRGVRLKKSHVPCRMC